MGRQPQGVRERMTIPLEPSASPDECSRDSGGTGVELLFSSCGVTLRRDIVGHKLALDWVAWTNC